MSDHPNSDDSTEPHASSNGSDASDGMNRRRFLKSTAAGLLVGALAGSGFVPHGRSAPSFTSQWPTDQERFWIGPQYWANPLGEWRISDGRIECIGMVDRSRNVQHLTRRLGEKKGTLDLRVQVGFAPSSTGRAGLELGVQSALDDYRHSVIHGEGLKAGVTPDGTLFIGDTTASLSQPIGEEGVGLHLTAAPESGGTTLVLSAFEGTTDTEIGQVRRTGVETGTLTGNLALFADVADAKDASREWGDMRAWFRDWEGQGSRLTTHGDSTFGPILFTHYTLSRGIMKMTAQLPPIGPEDGSTVELQTKQNGAWTTIDEARVHDRARTATFRVEDWDDTRDVPYRLQYQHRTAEGTKTHHYDGTIRRDPVDKSEIVVGGLSCAKATAFPNSDIVGGLDAHDPDLLAFTGDQYYEESGNYVRRAHDNVSLATLDVLYRWYLHGWTYGDLTRNRPSVCLLDDHDVFHANVWGEGGDTFDQFGEMADGGFFMPVEWVNAVQRMQTAHMPDPYDPSPIKNGITVYYTDMVYGRVSFALLEDRKWKTGPNDFIDTDPDTPDDWVVDPDFDPEAADAPGAKLLGERQLTFLEDWAEDWRRADMKAVISQTSFAQLPTHHGPQFKKLVADLDSNGWPQTPRDEALRRMRKGFALHIGGDQHLPMMLRYGIDDWNDAPYNFCVPGVAVGWTRAFWPEREPRRREPGMPSYGGEYRDGFNNKMTVHAVANPIRDFEDEDPLQMLQNKSSGYGVIRFDKDSREITMECWPLLSDPAGGASEQYADWPKTVAMEDNYAREAAGYLPPLRVDGAETPMIQVVDEERGEVVYTKRLDGPEVQAKVFRRVPHTIRVGDDVTWQETLTGLQPQSDTGGTPRTVQL